MIKKQNLDFPVYINVFPCVEDDSKDRIEIIIGENVVDVWGSMTGELLTGLEYVFQIVPCEEGNGYEFAGRIKRNKDGKLPHCSIKVNRSITNQGMRTFFEISMSGYKMRYTHSDQEAPKKLAAAFAQVLGLAQKDKTGHHYAGVVTPEVETAEP
jgi:hypothetical protein